MGAEEGNLERAKGIEPSYRAWEALVLPLNYARLGWMGLYACHLVYQEDSEKKAPQICEAWFYLK